MRSNALDIAVDVSLSSIAEMAKLFAFIWFALGLRQSVNNTFLDLVCVWIKDNTRTPYKTLSTSQTHRIRLLFKLSLLIATLNMCLCAFSGRHWAWKEELPTIVTTTCALTCFPFSLVLICPNLFPVLIIKQIHLICPEGRESDHQEE